VGSYIGSKARKKIDNQLYIQIIKYLLSLLAIKMIIVVLVQAG
jgi:hypothetical protein